MAALDPITGDLTVLRGDLVRSDNPTAEHMLLRLLTERGSCFWDLDYGSTLHELPRLKLTAGITRSAEDRARAALAPLVQSGAIRDLSVSAWRADRNRLELALSARDGAQRPITFAVFVRLT